MTGRPIYSRPAAERRDAVEPYIGRPVRVTINSSRRRAGSRRERYGTAIAVAIVDAGTISDVLVVKQTGYFAVAIPLAIVEAVVEVAEIPVEVER